MKFLEQVLNVVSVLIPDFLLVSWIAADLFGLYTMAKACGLLPTTDGKLGLEVTFTLAYVMAIAVDGVSPLSRPADTQPGKSVGVFAQARHHPCGVSSNQSQAPSIETRVLVTHR